MLPPIKIKKERSFLNACGDDYLGLVVPIYVVVTEAQKPFQ
jgi:hypothetical protein